MLVSLQNPKCAACDKFCHKVPGQKKKIQTEKEAKHYGDNLQRTIAVNDVLCGKCRVLHYKKKKLDVDTEKDDLEQTLNDPSVNIRLKTGVDRLNDETIEVPIQRTVSTHKYCCVCYSSSETTVIPEEARLQAFIKMRIHIPAGNR